ncbi:MAG: GntR family transcriptional regulator [Anaerolineaceae bacterium]|nr:GntR family transcriptional regulator [Anaerolineaceae bacterium]
MPKDIVTAEEIQQAIMNRIMSRQYVPGERLPSVRDLADQLRSNRNTVNKAYQMLADLGVIESLPGGRKGFLVKEIAGAKQEAGDELNAYFYQQAVKLAWQALAAGMPADEALHYLTNAIQEVYGLGDVRIAFYECNEHDSQEMGEYLSRELGMDMDYGTLDDLYVDVDTVMNKYDLIVTTFHHLSDVIERLGRHTEQIIGIDTRMTPEAMLGIARLPNPQIALVATLETTSHMLKHIIFSYYPDRQVDAVTITDTDGIIAAVEQCDHLVVTHTCADQVKQLTGREPDVIVNFQVDEQSIQFLGRRIHETQTQKTAAFQPQLASQV